MSDRYELYRICERCRLFGGSPSEVRQLHRLFPASVCETIDEGLAQFTLWYQARLEATEKSGKYGRRPKFKTMAEVLGITEFRNRGGMTGAELTDASTAYRNAVTAAVRAGQPIPDIGAFMHTWHNPGLES